MSDVTTTVTGNRQEQRPSPGCPRMQCVCGATSQPPNQQLDLHSSRRVSCRTWDLTACSPSCPQSLDSAALHLATTKTDRKKKAGSHLSRSTAAHCCQVQPTALLHASLACHARSLKGPHRGVYAGTGTPRALGWKRTDLGSKGHTWLYEQEVLSLFLTRPNTLCKEISI